MAINPRSRAGFGVSLRWARTLAGLTQKELARRAGLHRIRLVRAEAGLYAPQIDEVVRLAAVLKVPLSLLATGRWLPANDLRGIAVELYRLGFHDLEVSEPQVPGAFRHPEEVLVLAVRGDRPEPRVIEAVPAVLARRRLRVPLLAGFANVHDPRALTRLAWLSDVTLALSRLATAPFHLETEVPLSAVIRAGRPAAEPDSLGHPGTSPRSPVWRRWNITYGGTLPDFLRRTTEVMAAAAPTDFRWEDAP
jgi:transcriptional regulator with XRE-family HTH domain